MTHAGGRLRSAARRWPVGIALTALLALSPAAAGELPDATAADLFGSGGGRMPEDPFRGDAYRLYDREGRFEREIRRNGLDPDRLDVYDRRGRLQAELRRDRLREDTYRLYDREGRFEREIRRNGLDPDRLDVYDRRGRLQAELRRDRFREGTYRLYDRKGRLLGTVEADSFRGGDRRLFGDP